MNSQAIFGAAVLMSLLSASVLAGLYAWPFLRSMERRKALSALVAPHMFLRYLGLAFLVPGVVSPSLPAGFAIPAAFGDFVAGILAAIATIAIARRASWAIGATWAFNVFGAADLLVAFVQGRRTGLVPGNLGAGYLLVTAVVPLLLVTHFLVFRVLLVPDAAALRRPVSIEERIGRVS